MSVSKIHSANLKNSLFEKIRKKSDVLLKKKVENIVSLFFILSVTLCLFPFVTYAQSDDQDLLLVKSNKKGHVYIHYIDSATKKQVNFVNITILKRDSIIKRSNSDTSQAFHCELLPGEYIIYSKRSGYKINTQTITIISELGISITISLVSTDENDNKNKRK